jgi:NAD(P)H-hydrate epimerase
MQEIPFLTTDQMREVDRAMIEDFRIELVQMMENAGRNLAHLARSRFLGGDPTDKQVLVMCGRGGNGGGGLVCARRLANWGASVQVLTTHPAGRFRGVPAHQLDILRRMGVPVSTAAQPPAPFAADLIVDAVIGYSLSGAPRGLAGQMIDSANGYAKEYGVPILSLDTPSGVDATTGTVYDPAVCATATMTLALPKEGLRPAMEAGVVGELYLADISVPPRLYSAPPLQLNVHPLFAHEEIIRIH